MPEHTDLAWENSHGRDSPRSQAHWTSESLVEKAVADMGYISLCFSHSLQLASFESLPMCDPEREG